MKENLPPLSGTEIVELAVQIEKNGRDFYNGLSTKLKTEEARELFRFMASEEEKHIHDFEKILASVQKYQPCQSYPQEYFSYLRAISKEQVFTMDKKTQDKIRELATEKEAVDFNLGLEKDSILFYQEMKKFLSEEDKKMVDEIITQEKNHVTKLWDLRNKTAL